MAARLGRPKTRESESRAYIGAQIPAGLKRQLEAAAKNQLRSISAEATSRLHESFVFEGVRPLAFAMATAYAQGPSALSRALLNMQDNDEERWLFWQGLMSALLSWRAQHPDIFEE